MFSVNVNCVVPVVTFTRNTKKPEWAVEYIFTEVASSCTSKITQDCSVKYVGNFVNCDNVFLKRLLCIVPVVRT